MKSDGYPTKADPCSGAKAKLSIELALKYLEIWARRFGQSLEGKNRKDLPQDAQLFVELLEQSLAGMHLSTVPMIARGDLAAPIGLQLTRLRFLQFQRWFEKNLLQELNGYLAELGGLPIRADRLSSGKGGDPAISEAKYFLTFAKFERPSKQLRQHQNSSRSLNQEHQEQTQQIPPGDRTNTDSPDLSKKEGEAKSSTLPNSNCNKTHDSRRNASTTVELALMLSRSNCATPSNFVNLAIVGLLLATTLLLGGSMMQSIETASVLGQLITNVSNFLRGNWQVIF
jgi:hypothetical protein